MVGKDEDGEFYSGIMVFMTVGLNKSIPYVVKAVPEIKLTGDFVKQEIEECLRTMQGAGFNTRAVISDNHSTNVTAFASLQRLYGARNSGEHYIIYFEMQKVYLMYDSVRLIKNVRNNLLSNKRFIFPPFEFSCFRDGIKVTGGEITWALLHKVHEEDAKLKANLRAAPKLDSRALHPGNNKQDVTRALSISQPTTTAGIKKYNYFPENQAAAEFLHLFEVWWTISHSKCQFSNNLIGHAAVLDDKKPQFLRAFADWVETWETSQVSGCKKFTLTKQTSHALTTTLPATACLIEDLLNEHYAFVLTVRFQSDPIERHFSKYRQMSGRIT